MEAGRLKNEILNQKTMRIKIRITRNTQGPGEHAQEHRRCMHGYRRDGTTQAKTGTQEGNRTPGTQVTRKHKRI